MGMMDDAWRESVKRKKVNIDDKIFEQNEISEDTILAQKIENLILTKARRLRIQNKLN